MIWPAIGRMLAVVFAFMLGCHRRCDYAVLSRRAMGGSSEAVAYTPRTMPDEMSLIVNEGFGVDGVLHDSDAAADAPARA